MAATESTMLELGTPAPHFALPDLDGNLVCIDDLWQAKALLVCFLCPHCPYVRHVRREIAAVARDYADSGLATVGIMPNDLDAYPQDGPEGMRQEAGEAGYPFPYLLDETQSVARAYRAACTPDFFLFDQSRNLVYRGQLDSSRPGNEIPVTGQDLRGAVDAVLAGDPVTTEQRPSIGCSIKWKPGNSPYEGT
jgi:peroxiredoxin